MLTRGAGRAIGAHQRKLASYLYPYAWADFVRFLVDWAPEHYEIHGYSLKVTERVLREINP